MSCYLETTTSLLSLGPVLVIISQYNLLMGQCPTTYMATLGTAVPTKGNKEKQTDWRH